MRPCIFFSHTWLGFKHPDPSGVKQKAMPNSSRTLAAAGSAT